jgi:hypothetical protein
MVIWKVIQTDRMINYLSKFYRDRGREDMTKVLEKHRNSKAVLVQACSYITAFLLGVTPPLLLSVGAVDTSGKTQVTTVDQFEKITLIFLPLQGFFNFIIFVSFKVYNYRRVHPDVSIGRVIKLLFCTFSHEPLFISRISFVKQYEHCNDFVDNTEMNKRPQVYQFDIKDESNEELRYRLGLMDCGAVVQNISMDNLEEQSQGENETYSSGMQCNSINMSSKENVSKCLSEKVDEKNCNINDSCISFASSRSSAINSLWERDLSMGDEVPEENNVGRTYYRS